MTHDQQNERIPSNPSGSNIKVWKHGQFPMPDWLPQYMAGGIGANGTFMLKTELGHSRVHLGNVVIERCGTVWVRSADEASKFIESLRVSSEAVITNVGPGKVRQFGSTNRIKSKKVRSTLSERQLRYSPPTGSQPSIEWIHLNRLSIDGAYQRSTDNDASRRLIASIASKFDWRLCAPLVVSRRSDDTLTIIDGQHRWMAACRRDDIPQLPCCIFRYETTAEEARMFILANRARKPMNRLDDYYAALAAADEDALEIQQLVTDAGLRIARNTSSTTWRPGEIAFTASIANSIRRFGPAITSAVLTNMAVAFPDQKMSHGGAIFGGLVHIMTQPRTNFDPDRLVCALQTQTAEEWGKCVVGLKGGDMRAVALRDAIMEAYNKLPDSEQA
jgi:hypothetical protein